MGNVIGFARDSLKNFVSMLGTGRDKVSGSIYSPPLWTEADLINAYRGAWLPKKIVDIPALDSCRVWRNWQAKAEQISKIEAEERRLNLKAKVLEARIKARLFGGAALYIGTGDKDPSKPLNLARIGRSGLRYVVVMTRRHLTALDVDNDPMSEFYGKPRAYQIAGARSGSIEIHPSRLAIFQGSALPDEDVIASGMNVGWSDSVLISTLNAIRNADATAANVASLVFEAKIDVIRVPNMAQSMGDPEYRSLLAERFQLAATAKGINQTLLLDKDEEYLQKSASFTNLPDVMMTFLQICAGAADIPLTRLVGQSLGGLNASGEHDMKNYHDRITSEQELDMTPALYRLDEALIRSALGNRPNAITYEWAKLEQMNDKDMAEIGQINASSATALTSTGLIPREVLSKAVINQASERGIYPGIDGEMAAYLERNPDYFKKLEATPLPKPTISTPAKTASASASFNKDAAPRTLYVSRKVINAAAILKWAKSQGFKSTLAAGDLHVTVAFSREPVDWMKVSQPWDSRLTVPAGGPRLVEQFGGGAVVLAFKADDLEWRHQAIREAGASWDWPTYQPHITITYDAGDVKIEDVQPYTGEIVLGPEIFAEVDEDWKSGVTES